jgi:hypothetical protein
VSINEGMGKANMIYTSNGVFLSYKEELNYVVCWKMYGTEFHHVK